MGMGYYNNHMVGESYMAVNVSFNIAPAGDNFEYGFTHIIPRFNKSVAKS